MQDKGLALVSGSSKGIGRAIAFELARSGYRVLINGRNSTDVDLVVKSIRALDGIANPLVADLSTSDGIRNVSTLILNQYGPLSLVVANIGSGRTKPTWDIEEAELRRVFDVNFFAAIALFTETLRSHHPKHLIAISSIAGCESLGAPPAYSSAKAALLGYLKCLADQLASQGIRVNSLSPGNVMFDGSTWDDKIKKDKVAVDAYLQAKVPLNCFVKPEDIARGVVFLDQSPSMTGHNLIIDGGQVRKFY